MGRRQDEFVKLENEHEVIEKARLGCIKSMEVLYVQYLPFLRSAAARAERCYKSVDFDDALQQCAIYFMEAVRTFRHGHGTGFKYWVVKCVSLQLINFWKTQVIIRVPQCPETDELKKASERCCGVLRFSEMSKFDKLDEVFRIDPEDQSVAHPPDAAILNEEKAILESAIQKLEPLDGVLVRSRLSGRLYEECGEDVCRELGMNISTHREAVRQRAVRAFLRLEDRIYEIIGIRRMDRSKSLAAAPGGIRR